MTQPAFVARCPSCDGVVSDVRGPPVRGPEGGDWWQCFRCPSVVCTGCYVAHTMTVHTEAGQPRPEPTEGGKKRR